MAKYKLNIKRDVDIAGDYTENPDYILNLPYGFRFSDDLVHVRGYDSMTELKAAALRDIVACNCQECAENKGK